MLRVALVCVGIAAHAAALSPGEVGSIGPRRPRKGPFVGHSRHLACSYGALCSIVATKAVVSQALPIALGDMIGERDRVAEMLGTVAASSAALEFAVLPAIGAFSDTRGRKVVMLAMPTIAMLMRLLVVAVGRPWALIVSRLVTGVAVNTFYTAVSISFADLFTNDSRSLASLEGKSAACWGAAYAGGMLLGARLIVGRGILAAYSASAGFALLALILAAGADETLPPDERVPYSVNASSPLAFSALFTRGRVVATLSAILALQALHDGEGDIWQLYAAGKRGWGTQANSYYGSAVGAATTAGGLLTGPSVRLLGAKMHSVWWTASTALSSLLFTTRSNALAAFSVILCAAEDCMSAAVIAKIVQAGAAAGLTQGQIGGASFNLAAISRVLGLFAFGRLYGFGLRFGLPQLPYILFAAAQFAAIGLIFTLPANVWRDTRAPDDDGGPDAHKLA